MTAGGDEGRRRGLPGPVAARLRAVASSVRRSPPAMAAHRRISRLPFVPGAVRWGTLRRAEPFCAHFGYTRGTPVDRVYIERFLTEHASLVTGDVMEVLSPAYTRRFGTGVNRAHVVDIDAGNPEATLVADLCAPGSLPAAAFDAIVLTQTLHLLPDPTAALANMWDALRPGGALLLTVPSLSRLCYGAEPETDFWRWTPDGFRRLLATALPDARATVGGHGNLVTCMAFLLALAAEELRPAEFAEDDPVHPLVVTALVRRAP